MTNRLFLGPIGQRGVGSAARAGVSRTYPPHLITSRHYGALGGRKDLGVGPYVADAVTFDGTADWLNRGADLTGSVDGKVLTISFWIKFNGGDGSNQGIRVSTSDRISLIKNTSNKIRIATRTSAGATVCQMFTTSTLTASSGWNHILIAIDAANTTSYLYLNGVDDEDTGSTIINDATMDHTVSEHVIGAGDTGGSSKMNADFFDYWEAQEFVDISQLSNRRKFIDAGGKPVNLGADGSIPTGNQPIIFQHLDDGGTASDFATNLGSGGGFTENGALAVAGTSPTD